MVSIQDILKIDISKIENEKVKPFVEEFISDYKGIDDESVAVKIMQERAELLYKMIQKSSPAALPTTSESPCDDKVPEDKPKKKTPKKKQEKVKKATEVPVKKEITKAALNELEEEVKVCRVKMKMYREEKRKLEEPNPPPSRYAKIKGHFISLGNLIPKNLKENLEVQKETNKVLRNAHRALLKTYRMTAVKGKKDNDELKERYQKIEEKLEN